MSLKYLLTGAVLAATTALASPVLAATVQGDVPTGWTFNGNAGSGTADGDIVAAPTASGEYTYVSTTNGLSGVGALPGVGGTGNAENGSTMTTSSFTAAAGDNLEFFFNYLTSDGSGFADYAWARLLDDAGGQVALLFTARTTPGGSSVPGFSMPVPEATLTPSSVNIVPNATDWSAIGSDSGRCFATGCGHTGWVESNFMIADAGDYQLQFGVTNWNDSQFASGMAIAGANIGGVNINPNDPPVNPNPIPLPAGGVLLIGALGAIGMMRRRKRS
ncbi:MAG: NF038132 family protein [Sedimentitalea sp.]